MPSIESQPIRSRLAIKYVIAPLAATAFLLTGCGKPNSAPTPKKVSAIFVIPNFSKLTKGGVSCEQGFSRPCYQPLYKSPEEERPLTTADIVNSYTQTGDIVKVSWPYEAHNNPTGGNPVEVVCQVKGESIPNAYGQRTSVWDIVRVPRPELNPASRTEAESSNPGFGVEKNSQGRVEAVYADASSQWLGGTFPQLKPCTPAENPAGYPAA